MALTKKIDQISGNSETNHGNGEFREIDDGERAEAEQT